MGRMNDDGEMVTRPGGTTPVKSDPPMDRPAAGEGGNPGDAADPDDAADNVERVQEGPGIPGMPGIEEAGYGHGV